MARVRTFTVKAPETNGKTTAQPPKPPKEVPQVEFYKGHPLIALNPASKWPFKFGIGKAKLILGNLAAIQEFVREYEAHNAAEGGE